MPVQQIQAIAGACRDGGNQTKEREFERIYNAAKTNVRKTDKRSGQKRGYGFSQISCVYGKRAVELGFAGQPVIDVRQ